MTDQSSARRKWMRRCIIGVLLIAVAMGGRWYANKVKLQILTSAFPGLLELNDTEGILCVLKYRPELAKEEYDAWLLEEKTLLPMGFGWEEYPLHAASRHGNIRLAKALLELGADVNAEGCESRTPLFYAKTKEVARLLLDAGADAYIRSSYGETPLFTARSGDVAKTLIETKADVNARSIDGDTALFHAENSDITRALIEAGADVNAVDNGGSTALFHAKSSTVVELLAGAGAQVNLVNKYGNTPLLSAAIVEVDGIDKLIDNPKYTPQFHPWRSAVVRALVKAGANVDQKDEDGKVPLHKVTSIGSARALIDAGANVNVRDKRGLTPLDLCEVESIRSFLRKHGAKTGEELGDCIR